MPELDKEYRIAQLLAKKMVGDLALEENAELQELQANADISDELVERILNLKNKQKRDEFVGGLNVEGAWKQVEKESMNIKRKNLRQILWACSAAAAVALVFVYVNFRVMYVDKTQEVLYSKVEPGSAKAILTTADGKQYNLFKQDSSQFLDVGGGLEAINYGNVIKYVESSEKKNAIPNVIKVPKGGEYELILPDGTHVWINADSKLSFPSVFDSSKREVFLSGEAYFSVKKDKDRPFIVKTDNIKIEVLGTEFNVKSYPELKEIATTLCEGSVSVTDGSHDLILKPSYQAIYSKSSHLMTSKKVDTRLYTGWKNGLFIFENETLEDIMITLSRWYNINVFFVNERIKTFHFTGDLKRYGDFTKTLEMIEKTTSIQFVINGNNILVEEKF